MKWFVVSYPGIRCLMMSCCAVCRCNPRARAPSLRCWCTARTRPAACSLPECPGLKRRRWQSSVETSLTETRGQTLASGTVEMSSHCPALSAGWRPESDSLPLKRALWTRADSQVCARAKSRSQNLCRLLALPLCSKYSEERGTKVFYTSICASDDEQKVLRLARALIEEFWCGCTYPLLDISSWGK